jgi:predicted Holliday junction resolvase-like endonuclease
MVTWCKGLVQKYGAIMAAKAVRERLNLYLSKDVIDDLRRQVPDRERTSFVEETLRRELRRRKLLEAIDASYGAWQDEDHPELATPEDIDRWIEEGRKAATRDWSEEYPPHA